MDAKTQQIVEQGKVWIEMMEDDPLLPLDYSEKSMKNLQTLVTSLKNSGTTSNYQNKAILGMTVYLGEMIKNQFNQMEFVFDESVEGGGLTLQVRGHEGEDKVRINLTTIVMKAYRNEEEDLEGKYQAVIRDLKKELKS